MVPPGGASLADEVLPQYNPSTTRWFLQQVHLVLAHLPLIRKRA